MKRGLPKMSVIFGSAVAVKIRSELGEHRSFSVFGWLWRDLTRKRK